MRPVPTPTDHPARRHAPGARASGLSPATLRLLLALGAVFAAAPASAVAFDSVSQGATLDVSLGTTPVGDLLMGELGGQSVGITSLGGGKWLLQWDGLVGFKAGELAAAHPYTTLLGGHGRAFAEGGYRFEPESPWSLYVGARMGGDLQIMVPPGKSLSELDTINNIDGVGNVNVSGALRVVAGASLLTSEHSLLLGAFVQEAGRLAETNLRGAAFTEVGLALRFDIARELMLSAEAAWGRTPSQTVPALGLSDQTTNKEFTASVRKIFSNGMWLHTAVSYAVETDATTYAASATTYSTANAANFGLTILYGFPLGKQQCQ